MSQYTGLSPFVNLTNFGAYNMILGLVKIISPRSQDRIRTCMRNFLGLAPMARCPLVILASTFPPPDYFACLSKLSDGSGPLSLPTSIRSQDRSRT